MRRGVDKCVKIEQVIGRDPVATIVYKHALHTISLTTLPVGQSVPDQVVSGYNVRSWSDAEFTYVAVSDLPSPDLATFERAFSAIFDSNITAAIAGVVLWLFGAGAVRGFAVVLVLGIATSMFTALMGSRALVQIIYGGKRKVERLSI